MSKFKTKRGKESPAINTSSLPDIIFMLLFFFMVTTTMREVTLKVKMKLPEATEVQKLEKKSLVSYIYVGTPVQSKMYGTNTRIQLNDEFATLDDIQAGGNLKNAVIRSRVSCTRLPPMRHRS